MCSLTLALPYQTAMAYPLKLVVGESLSQLAYLLGYDISAQAARHRRDRTEREAKAFVIENCRSGVRMEFDGELLTLELPESMLLRNLVLKLMLNAHSTLLAGKLGRYEGNWMTWVKPSNLKLIDRAIRYVRQILVARGETDPGYESICYSLFEIRASLELNESIVIKTVDHISSSHA